MSQPKIKYDEKSDSLTVSFETGVPATGIELTDQILLRVNLAEHKAISIVFFDYSILTQKTNLGIRSFPLTRLKALSEEFQEMVIEILLKQPVCKYLSVSDYTPSIRKTQPIISIKPFLVAV